MSTIVHSGPERKRDPATDSDGDDADVDEQMAFLTAFAANGSLGVALVCSRTTARQAQQWLENDPAFGQRFLQAAAIACYSADTEARYAAV